MWDTLVISCGSELYVWVWYNIGFVLVGRMLVAIGVG